jgi:hypothetical protein
MGLHGLLQVQPYLFTSYDSHTKRPIIILNRINGYMCNDGVVFFYCEVRMEFFMYSDELQASKGSINCIHK